MRFSELLRVSVLVAAAIATMLTALTAIAAADRGDPVLVAVSASWWTACGLAGAVAGRPREAKRPIARLLAAARSSSSLPEPSPGRTMLNRLWPLAGFGVVAGAVGVFAPPVAAICAGFAIFWPLSIRHQERAVEAIEERDGARFYVERTSPWATIALTRTPGFGGDFVPSPP